MQEQFDMSNSRRGSSPPFQEQMEVASRITPQGSIGTDALHDSTPSSILPAIRETFNGQLPANGQFA